MSANIAAAKGIEPCPICGSDQVRWRGRHPTDFVLTGLRYVVELFASIFASGELRQYRRGGVDARTEQALAENDVRFGVDAEWKRLGDAEGEMREATTSHKTPKRFWRCEACGREGHVF